MCFIAIEVLVEMWGLARVNGVVGIGTGWDCGRCRLDGLNGLFLYCRVSMTFYDFYDKISG